MAITQSGLYYLTFRDMYMNDTAVDWLADTIKVALVNNTPTPNFDTDTGWAAPYSTNEVGTPSGGIAIANDTITVQSGHVLTYDGDDTAWASQTFSNAYAGFGYDDTIATPTAKPALFLAYFTGPFSVTAGIFTIQWATAGIVTHDLA